MLLGLNRAVDEWSFFSSFQIICQKFMVEDLPHRRSKRDSNIEKSVNADKYFGWRVDYYQLEVNSASVLKSFSFFQPFIGLAFIINIACMFALSNLSC